MATLRVFRFSMTKLTLLVVIWVASACGGAQTPPPPTSQATNTPAVTREPWTPVAQSFDGVDMVKVPAGCFKMGSEVVTLFERPIHQICFDKSFWIDKFEVTNGQFNRLGGQAKGNSLWAEDSTPRNTITWTEARDFCKKRGSRLPTEAEWEYAARGPESLTYPWGNTFVAANVVYLDTSKARTEPVGSKPGGASWVGALDMSGNVSEWVSTLSKRYPYDAKDGREADLAAEPTAARVKRGGAFAEFQHWMVSARRDEAPPDFANFLSGFRCARDAS